VKIAELSLKAAQFEHEQAKRRYEEVRTSVQKMTLKSPIDGHIEKIHVEAGESVNALAEVIRIVRIDPLWIDVPMPMAEASAVRAGDSAQAFFTSPATAAVTGTVIFVAAVADAASGTRNVRVEVPNKTGRPAGEQVKMTFKQMDSKG
jgi:Cu(I)/Ag(I) efflux system membrane fusion protein